MLCRQEWATVYRAVAGWVAGRQEAEDLTQEVFLRALGHLDGYQFASVLVRRYLIAVSVRDRGPGIAAADLPHVFDRFYRAAAAGGLPAAGLGLAIVGQVAEAHGGSVEAGNAPGSGAVLQLHVRHESGLPTSYPILDAR